jgi:hypothetical protein
MILLGSIQRTELIGLIERHIGRDRRLQVAAKRQKEARVRYNLAIWILQMLFISQFSLYISNSECTRKR